jgi:tetratricopeptide (TPR) repeat protein
MNLPISRVLPVILLLALPLAACVSTTTLYRGEMELVTVSGDACPEKGENNSHVPLELVLERERSFGGQRISGYLNGPEIQTGHFHGDDITRLLVTYPDETGHTAQGHTLALSITSDGVIGELLEKPQVTSSNCYFEKAVLSLKNAAVGSEARAGFARQRTLFGAEEHYNRGQTLLKANNPEEALRDLAESLKLRKEVNPNDPNTVYPAFSIAIAHVMAGREGEALTFLRNLFAEKPDTGITMIKQRMSVSSGICVYTKETSGDARQVASEHLMDAAAREFGGLKEVGAILAECYRELGQEQIEQGDPEQSLEYFQKAVALTPNDADSIVGLIISHIARNTPAEGRRYLQEHAQGVIDKAGRESYNADLSYLYAAEAKQAEKERDYARAEQLLREALKILPGEHARIINLATVLGKAAKPDEARNLLEDARKRCIDEACRVEYTDELARQERIERIVKRLKRVGGGK